MESTNLCSGIFWSVDHGSGTTVASHSGGTWFVLQYDRLSVSEHQDAKWRLLIDEQGAWTVSTLPNVVISATR